METETPTGICLDQQIGSLENVGPNGASVQCYDHYLGIGERRIIIRLLVTTQLPRTGLPILVDGGVAFGHVHP